MIPILATRSSWGEGKVETLAMCLIERGIPFHTLLPDTSRHHFKDVRHIDVPIHIGILERQIPWQGSCEANWKPGVDDYASYVCQRELFLQSPHCRAALLRGGIVWRLALDSLSTAVAIVHTEFN